MKRAFDVTASILGLLFLGIPIIVLIGLVRATSTGPGIFAQKRIGRSGTTFICYKLRTMTVEAPNRATHETPAIYTTKLGKVLRKFKLDELPQLWNVLKGDMSLVGPRPCLPSQTTLVQARSARNVFSLRPGITGKAQVRGIDMSDPIKLAEIDASYILEQSLAGDLKIILQTLKGDGRRDGTASL